MFDIRGKREQWSLASTISGLAVILGIYTDGPGLARDLLANAPAWAQNPKVQWCAVVIAVWAYVMWRIWRKTTAQPEPEDYALKFARYAATISPKAHRAAQLQIELAGFRSHLLSTPNDRLNEDYVVSMIRVVYPQRIEEAMGDEVAERYKQSLAKVKRKSGQHISGWAILVFQSAFQLVMDEVWKVVETEADSKPGGQQTPYSKPELATGSMLTGALFGVLMGANFASADAQAFYGRWLGAFLFAIGIAYLLLSWKRLVQLTNIATSRESQYPSELRKTAVAELIVVAVATLALVATVWLHGAYEKTGNVLPPLRSTFVSNQLSGHLDRHTEASIELTNRVKSGELDDKEAIEAFKELNDEATRLLDVTFPALIASYYGEEEREKFRREIDIARKSKTSKHDNANLQIAGTFIHALVLRESSKERAELKAELERLFGQDSE